MFLVDTGFLIGWETAAYGEAHLKTSTRSRDQLMDDLPLYLALVCFQGE